MLFVRDKGRMCNNILQYGHAYAWGREHDVKTVSMRFAYKYRYFNICHRRWHSFPVYVFVKFLAAIHLIPTIKFHDEKLQLEPSAMPHDIAVLYATNQQRMKHRRMVVAEGWSLRFYDLFLKYKKDIIDLFTIEDDIVSCVDSFIDAESQKGDILLGVHIRRGDYKTFKDGRYFYSDKQYQDVIRAFCQQHSDKHVTVFICTNDMQLDREAYRSALGDCCGVADMITGKHGDVLDLCLLSKCDYIIGAPSTYSLVASMYNDTPLLWLHEATADAVSNPSAWGTFNTLFRHIV